MMNDDDLIPDDPSLDDDAAFEALDVATLPEVIPLFPLSGALLLPRAHMPLNIFEPRYLAMTRDALAGGRVIGMIQPTRHQNTSHSDGGAEQADEPPLYSVGCVGRIVDHRETPDGRILITLLGLARFSVQQELDRITPYRKAVVSYDRFGDDGVVGVSLAPSGRARLEATLEEYLSARGLDADWDALASAPDERLVNAMAMMCPFDSGEKQAILEAVDLDERCETMMTLMEFAIRDLSGPSAGPH
ncbi:MAG: LON peptidase substrate-binding domain-containing protein [Sphingomonadales bacterium]